MFQGTLPQSVRAILKEEVERWKCSDLYLPCSGRFTVARGMLDCGLRIHGNDISLYSCALGAFYAGAPFPVELKDDDGSLGWMAPFMTDQESRLASVIIWSDMAMAWAKREVNAYYRRLAEGYRQQYPRLHEEVKRKMEAAKLRLASFWAGDCVDYIRDIPEGAGIITAPPVYAGGYEVMWKYLEQRFVWQAPEYEMFDDARFEELLDLLLKRERWAIITQSPIARLESCYFGRVRETDRGTMFYVYAAGRDHTRLVQPDQKVEPLLVSRLEAEEELPGPLTLRPLSQGEFNALRAQYLNPNIPPGAAGFAFGVLSGAKVIGVLAALRGRGPIPWPGVEDPMLYLMSDFPVAPTRYPRLSKLIVMAALSHEFRMLAERACNCRFNSVGTTAFTAKPVSMKYRGVLQLMKRADTEPPDQARGFLHKINYAAPMGRWSLDEALAEWRRRYLAAEVPT